MSKQYKVRISDKQIIGPFAVAQLIELYNRNHISGKEKVQLFPDGEWTSFNDIDDPGFDQIKRDLGVTKKSGKVSDELDQLEHKRKKSLHKEFKFSVDGNKIDDQMLDRTRVLKEYDEEKVKEEILQSFKNRKGRFGMSTTINGDSETNPMTMTRCNPLEESLQEVVDEGHLEVKTEIKDDIVAVEKASPEVDRFDKTVFVNIDKHLPTIKRKVEKYEDKVQLQEMEEDEGTAKKRNVLVLGLFLLAAMYFYLEGNDSDELKPPVFAEVRYPLVNEVEDVERSKVAYEKGLKSYAKGRYIDKLRAASFFRQAIENQVRVEVVNKDVKQKLLNKAFGNLILVYAEIFNNVKNDKISNSQRKKGKLKKERAKAGATLYKLIEIAKSKALTDVNAATGKALFFIKLNKYRTALTVLENFALLANANSYQSSIKQYKFFAYYLDVLVELNLEKTDKAVKIYERINPVQKNIKKPIEVYYSLYKYLLAIGKEKEAKEKIKEVASLYKNMVGPLLKYAYITIEDQDIQKTKNLLNIIKLLHFERSPVYYSEFYEIVAMKYALDNKLEDATVHFKKALRIHDSDRLRSQLSNLELGGGKAVDALIVQSKVLRLVEKSKRQQRQMRNRQALYTAIEAIDLAPGNVLASLQLADVQIARGFYKSAIDQLLLIRNRERFKIKIVSKRIMAYIGAKMIKEANHLVRETPLLDEYEFHSASARYYQALGKSSLDLMIRALRTSIEINPLADQDYYLLAKIYLKHNRFKESRWMLHKAMALDPTNILYNSLYAKIIYEHEGIAVAAGYVRDLLKEYPNEPKLLADLAIYYYRDQQMANFNGIKKKIELSAIKDVSFYEFMISVSKKEGKVQDVIKYSKGYVLVNPGNVEVRMELAVYLYNKEKYDEALKEIDGVLERIITFPQAHALLSIIYTKITPSEAVFVAAKARYFRAIKLDMQKIVQDVMKDNLQYTAKIIALEDKKAHELLIEEVLVKVLAPAFKNIIEMGIIKYYKSVLLPIFVKAKITGKMLTDDSYLYSFIDRILAGPFRRAELPDLAQLEAMYEINHNPQVVDGYYALGEVYVRMRIYKKAVYYFEKAVSIDMNHVDSLLSLASIRHREGFHDIAKELYERALNLDASRTSIYKELGKLYEDMGQTSLAIEFYENFIKLNPASSFRNAIQNKIKELK